MVQVTETLQEKFYSVRKNFLNIFESTMKARLTLKLWSHGNVLPRILLNRV